jgi:hypothetical protein
MAHLAEKRQELVRVRCVKLLEQREHADDKGRAVDRL